MGVGRFIAVAIVGVCAGLALDAVRPASAQFLTMPSMLSPAPAPAPAPVQSEEPAPAPAPAKAKPKAAKAKPKPQPAVASTGDGATVQPVASKPAAGKAAAKLAANKNPVIVDNRRQATLVELTITSKDRNGGAAVIARDVSPGGRVNAKLPAKGGCVWDVSGSFDDESTLEVASVNLCKDPRLTLVE